MAENICEYRALKNLEDSIYCEKLLFFMNHSLGKFDQRDISVELYLEKIAHVIKESTDKFFQLSKRKDVNPEVLDNKSY